MLARFIICQSCGCKGRASNISSSNETESWVFLYEGHNPFDGMMRYYCLSCNTKLIVDPMDMLVNDTAKGVPDPSRKVCAKSSWERILHKIPKRNTSSTVINTKEG